MKKNVVVIASALKPVTDPRMYEKIGMALVRRENHEVHVMGFCSRKHVCVPNMYFHVLLCANRLSWKRFTVSLKYYKKLLEVKPDLIVVNSPDLLIVTIAYKILFRPAFIYDIHENYYYNLVYGSSFPMFIRNMFAVFVRGVEWCTRPFADAYLLAERCYARELPFVKDKYEIVENKYEPLSDVLVVPRRRGRYRLLYTGTIAESYGIYEAVALAKALHRVDARYTLTVIGYEARPAERQRLRELVKDETYIRLVGVDHPVPHEQIIRAIGEADLALTPYRDNRSFRDKIPTKFFEYIYHRIPFVIPRNPAWEAFCCPYGAAMAIDFFHFDAPLLSSQFQALTFYNYYNHYEDIQFKINTLATKYANIFSKNPN
jgi:glycosyltransferase involved in cell wall biosynthesis